MKDGVVTPPREWVWSMVPKLVEEIRKREGKPDLPVLPDRPLGGRAVRRPPDGVRGDGGDPPRRRQPEFLPLPQPRPALPLRFRRAARRARRRRRDPPLPGPAADDLRRHGRHLRDRDLDKSRDADQQGANRLERGRAAYEAARLLAIRNGWKFGWTLVEATNVGHEARAMLDSPACEEALFGVQDAPKTKTVTNSIGMKLVKIPAGEFVMGMPDTPEEMAKVFPLYKGEFSDRGVERLQELTDMTPHKVRITRPFSMGIHEVTIGQFKRFVEETGFKTESERDGTGGYGIDLKTKTWATRRDPKYSWQQPWVPARRRPPGHEHHLGRRRGVLRLVEQEGGQDLPPANRGGMGVCLPGGHHHALQFWRRPRRAGQEREHLRRLGGPRVPRVEAVGHQGRRRLPVHGPGRQLPPQRLGPLRHARERLGMVLRLLCSRLLRQIARG